MEDAEATTAPVDDAGARALAVEGLRRGADRDAIVSELVGRGMHRDHAWAVVGSVDEDLLRARDAEAYDARAMAPAAVAGLVAALVGGALWGVITAKSDYEIGFVAWGIGFLAGTAVVFAARGRKGVPLQAVAVICAALGFLLGKYLAFAITLHDQFHVGVLSSDAMTLFRENLDVSFSFWDVLWAGFALWAAWRVPRPLLGRARTG